MPARALTSLVTSLVDYAGLFPPASRSMDDAVADYAGYGVTPERWMLGRFVSAVGRLDELATVLARLGDTSPEPMRIAAIGSADAQHDMLRIGAFNARHAGRATIDVLETKTTTAAEVARAADAAGSDVALYAEVPIAEDPAPLLDVVRAAGASAKVRTGGVTAEAFPSAVQVARFLLRCAERKLRWKATAGLHHPLRAEYPLTYAAEAPRGTMFGFLNVFVAGIFAHVGLPEADVALLLEERDPRALTIGDDGIRWRGHGVTAAQVGAVRDRFATSFGSCSFREPVDDLHRLGYL